ncbi:tryptophan--tRNA ligase [Dactylosporangium vinaceum]|uniref:Tryptophan--tRNA ligase n=1 Tax=Dactylosporangium vinaceum TaxID=53362 RepID=A0ABV5M5N3_9ACTN|nr:tryptophan--tRNA ligase [Dactylosporangium vinaceum]UAB95605.1 tryptophan--tRNA ligase [Dactylosporangium vinaceum]
MPTRRISGFKPTGPLQLGNYLGAIRPTVQGQGEETVVFVADLHALTVPHDPERLRDLTRQVAGLLLAAGVDPDRTVLYRQSDLPAHAELHYLLECSASYGEVHRMIQFKEKGGGSGTRLSLLTYPVLMAADILLHDITDVPVGRDQRQHVELTRDLALRFNERHGPVFTVPRAVHPQVAARVADLADPAAKMGKTNAATNGVLFLLDPPDVLRRKIMRAVTDAGTDVVYDPAGKPGVSNLLDLLATCTARDPARIAADYTGYGRLKSDVADAVIALLEPIQQRYDDLGDADIEHVLARGAERAADRADATVRRVRAAMGLAGRAATSARPAPAGSPGKPPTAPAPR